MTRKSRLCNVTVYVSNIPELTDSHTTWGNVTLCVKVNYQNESDSYTIPESESSITSIRKLVNRLRAQKSGGFLGILNY